MKQEGRNGVVCYDPGMNLDVPRPELIRFEDILAWSAALQQAFPVIALPSGPARRDLRSVFAATVREMTLVSYDISPNPSRPTTLQGFLQSSGSRNKTFLRYQGRLFDGVEEPRDIKPPSLITQLVPGLNEDGFDRSAFDARVREVPIDRSDRARLSIVPQGLENIAVFLADLRQSHLQAKLLQRDTAIVENGAPRRRI